MSVYFLVALAATTVGAMTGMGGGVIIKPVLDTLGDYDAASISMLSCLTVLAMSLVSVGRQLSRRTPFPLREAALLALGSVAGGYMGALILDRLIGSASNSRVLLCQNACLGVLILVVFTYMLTKDRLPTLHRGGAVPACVVGVVLGFFSSFLGIGGGPINVALLMFVFSYPVKTAAVCSLATILAAQVSKLASAGLSGGLAGLDLHMLPAMVSGAVLGGFIGSRLNRELPDRAVEWGFNAVQLVVFCICMWNIGQNI